ncbi:hypothetical protein OU798_03490 [Prolixibacteraceae bacterium Z1-6]|uniref:Glycoside hydrolase family 38 N-terminal domain-containing protein n=1 Tax=Draconibacterium aestuarii TaxID=2998507 RepID=A0A9X3F3Z0_9BACT|nr:hypothetical protein [Prolixibacteraceae bacterium Z1-6]
MRLKLLAIILLFNVAALGQIKPGDTTYINQNVKEIIVICKTHFDIGYTHRVKDLIPYYQTEMIDKALDIMDNTKNLPEEQQFSWTAPGWVMSKVLEDWPGQTPLRRQRLDDAFKSGRFVVHAVPFTLESESMFPEGIVRGFSFSDDICNKYGLPIPRGAKMTDVPSQSNVLATVLANGGTKFLHLGCNWPSGYVKYPPLFWWEGPDGSRILTGYSHVYGTTVGLYPEVWTDQYPTDQTLGKNLIPPTDWPYPVWPAIIVTPDNSGPPTADDIQKLFVEANKFLPDVNIRMGTLEDFADAILAKHPNIPVIKKEAPDTWIHGYGCDPGGMKKLRNVQPLLPAAELLNTQLQQWGVDVPDAGGEIAEAFENTLLYAEHTWGGSKSINQYGEAFKELAPESYQNLEGSWDDKTDYIKKADNTTGKLLATNLETLAKNINTKGKRIVVYNSLPWSRSDWVKLPGSEEYFYAEDIPASGYKTFSADKIEAKVPPVSEKGNSNNTIENSFYKITFDPVAGMISSFVDKRTEKEWAAVNSTNGLGQYMNERFTYEQTLNYTMQYQQGRAVKSFGTDGDWPHPGINKPGMISGKEVPYRQATSKNGTVNISKNEFIQVMTVDFPADESCHLPASSVSITLQNDMPYIDLEITIKDKARDNWPEADWLCLPFNINQPTFTVGRTLGTMNPLTDIVEGSNRHLYAVGSGVSITDADGTGVTVCPLDHPLISLGEPGMWKYSNQYIPQKPVVYLNLYNNQWNTNFRYWYPGTWSSRVRIWTFDSTVTEADRLQIPSFEARTPLLVAEADGKKGVLPAMQQGISLSRKGIEVTAFNKREDGLLLRVWEQAGDSGELTITIPSEVKINKAQPVNLRGEKTGDSIAVKNGMFRFNLGKYAPASFILK